MTTLEKQSIIERRDQGETLAHIARSLKIPVNTVKTICHRNALSIGGSSKCKQCGQEFIVKPHSKAKSFCSDACRYKWWNANRQAQTKHMCEHCGREFISYESAQRRFCGRSCYIAHRFSEGGVLSDKGAV